MEVDATCIVQIGHFIIAYYMLKYFLLKPLVAKVQAQDRMMRTLQEDVETRKFLVQQQEQGMLAQWVAYQKEFADTIPVSEIPDMVIASDAHTRSIEGTVEMHEEKRIVDELKQEIVAKVGRVH